MEWWNLQLGVAHQIHPNTLVSLDAASQTWCLRQLTVNEALRSSRLSDRERMLKHAWVTLSYMRRKGEVLYSYVLYTRSVRKVSDRIFLCEHLMDYNLARLHEPTLNLSAHA